jgi:hypothetical protein
MAQDFTDRQFAQQKRLEKTHMKQECELWNKNPANTGHLSRE